MNGEVTVADAALAQIVLRAAESVDGARVRRGTARRKPVIELPHVAIELAVRRGLVLPEVARAVQEKVADALLRMLEVDAVVDVSVEEVFA